MLDDLVAERTSSEGPGNLTLAAGSGGVRRFSTVFGTGSTNKFLYHIRHSNAGEYEQGVGYMSDADTLVRSRVLKSSNAGAAVDFSAGEKDVVSDLPGDAALVSLGLARLVYNASGAAIDANRLVAVTGYNSSEELPSIALADRSLSRRQADGYAAAQIEADTAGWILAAGQVTGVDTSGNHDGDPIFLDTAGSFSVGAPSAGFIQEVGNVVDTGNPGIVHFRLTQSRERRYLADWQSGAEYFLKELVIDDNKIYRCKAKHTAGASLDDDAANWDELNPASSGAGVQLSCFIETPEVKSYSLIGANGIAWDVNLCTVRCGSGSGTYSLEIDSGSGPAAVTGIAGQAITASESQAAASGANSLTAGGERLILNITANSDMADLEVTIKGTAA